MNIEAYNKAFKTELRASHNVPSRGNVRSKRISMVRSILVLIGLISLQGCTVGWYSLRDSNKDIVAEELAVWNCPVNFELNVASSYYTNTFGENESQPEYIFRLKEQLSSTTGKTLKELGCLLAERSESTKSKTLIVKVTEQKYLSALPQEWLTGLSLGVIPSWGTRPRRWKFEFKQGNYERTFVVDDTRFNHIIAVPFFWLSFPLMDVKSAYEEALREYAKNS